MNSNHIYVTDLELYAYHGVMEQERKVGNMFSVSLRLDCDFTDALENDTIAGTVSYADVIDIVKREMAIPSQTLENVCGRIRNAVRNAFPAIVSGMVKVAKLTPPISGTKLREVAVEVEW